MDVEAHLARFRAATPPPGLREQVLEACRRQQRSSRRPWPFVAAAAALFLLGLANLTIEERLSAKMPPATMPPPGPDASPPVLEGLEAGTLSRLFILPAKASQASPQSFIRLRLERKRSNS